MNDRRTNSRTSVSALIWVLLTTPLSTMPLLHLADRPGSPVRHWLADIPYPATVLAVAFTLIAPPLLGIVLGLFGLRRVQAAWVPRGGASYARAAIGLGIVSVLCAITVLIAGIFMG